MHECICVCACVRVCVRDKLISKTHFLLILMKRIINIVFPGLLGVLCPTGMACLPGFQPGFEHLNEVWDLEEEFACTCSFWYHLLLGAPKGNRTPSAKPHYTTDPQQGKPHEPLSSSPPHPRLCLYIHLLLPATTALGNASATSSRLHTALRPKNPSLTTSVAAHRPTPPSAAALTSLRMGRWEGSTPKNEEQELSLVVP